MNPPPRKFPRRIFGWLLFIGLAVMLTMLLAKNSVPRQAISLSDFYSQLLANHLTEINLGGDEITGVMTTSAGVPVAFRTQLPSGTSSNWTFTQWLLDHDGNAKVTVDVSSSELTNILVPLIPWLLIFGFIWFFVFRTLRKQKQTQWGMIPPTPSGAAFAAWIYPSQTGGPPPAPGTGPVNEVRPQ